MGPRLLVSLCIVACSARSEPTAAPPIDEPTVPITVEVRDLGEAVADVSVIFHRADGTVISWTTTDQNGMATGQGLSAGLVTAVSAARGLKRVVSVASIEPDAPILLDLPDLWGATWDQRELGDPVGTVEVEVPELAGASAYEWFFGCTSAFSDTTTATIELPERCVGPDDRIDVQATAWFNGKPQYPVGLTYASSVPFQRDNTTRVSLPSWGSERYTTTEFALANAPTDSVTLRVAGGLRADGLPFVGAVTSGSAVLEAGESAQLTLDSLADFGDGLDFTVALEHTTGRSHFTAVDHARTASVSLDLSADLLPPVLTHEVDSSDPQRPRLDWQLAGSLTGADGVFVFYHWFVDTGDLYWIAMAPPDAPERATFPALPDELAEFRPPDSFDGVFYHSVSAFDAGWVDGYGDLQRHHGPGFLTHAALPAGAHIIRYVYGGVMPVRTWIGRFPAAAK